MGSELGIPDAKILALGEYPTSPLYDEKERTALEYADAITLSGRDVDDELFERVRHHLDDGALVELTATIAWENTSSKFNCALRVPSQASSARSSAARRAKEYHRVVTASRPSSGGLRPSCSRPRPPT